MKNTMLLKKSLKSKFARSIVVPLILIFVIVLAAIIVMVFSSFISEMKSNVLERKVQQLKGTEQSITARISEVNSISYHVSQDSQFSFIPLDSARFYSGYEISKSLKNLLVGNGLISYLSYYRISEADKVYTSVGEMLFHTFWNGYIGLDDETEEQYLDQIRNIRNRKVLPLKMNKKGTKYMTMILPIPIYANTPSAYVLTYVNGEKLDDIASALYADCKGELLVYDLEDTLIYSFISEGYDGVPDEMQKEFYLLAQNEDNGNISYGGKDYLLLTYQSDYNGWKYVALISKDDITGSLTSKQINFLLLLFSVMVLAIIATIACVLYNYRFINRLAFHISEGLNMDISKESNEQLLLSNAFVSLIEKNQSATQNLFLSNLTAGQYDEETIATVVNEYNLQFEYSHYICSLVYFHKVIDSIQVEEIAAFIKEHFDVSNMQSYPLYQPNPNRVLIMINAAENMLYWENLEPMLSSLYYELCDRYNNVISIGVGNAYSSLAGVNESAHEALSAMYFCILEGERFIKRYNDNDMEYITTLLSGFTSRLVGVVRHGDIEGIHRIVSEMNAIFTDNSFSIPHQNFVAFNILTSLTEYVDSQSISEEINILLSSLVKRSRINIKIFDKIEDLCMAIARHRNEMKGSNKNTELLQTIVKTISDNLCDSMMSLESIADSCGISASYLSRYFKVQMGATPMNYVETLRMTMVKEKLCNTNDSLKQILLETGYIDQSNFIRKFKKMEGVTPMTYRKAHQNAEV